MVQVYLHDIGIVCSEVDAAKTLKSSLEADLSSYKGKIWLVPSLNIHPGTGRHDVDLLMMGYISDYYIDDIAGKTNIKIRNFFATIEIKSHGATGIFRKGTHLFVKYSGGDKNVTLQSEDQKESIRAFCLNQGIQIFTNVSEWLMDAQTITRTTGFVRNSQMGTNGVKPIISANGTTLFCPKNGKGIIGFIYNEQSASYMTPYIYCYAQ